MINLWLLLSYGRISICKMGYASNNGVTLINSNPLSLPPLFNGNKNRYFHLLATPIITLHLFVNEPINHLNLSYESHK